MMDAWEWEYQRQYDYWVVLKYKRGEKTRGTYGDAMAFRTRKDAERVTNALNRAFNDGIKYAVGNPVKVR